MLIKITPDFMPWRDPSPQRRGPNKRMQTAIVVVLLLLFWLWTMPRAFPGDRHLRSSSASSSRSSSPYAFVTLFAQHPKLDHQVLPDDQDEYFVGVRSLVYQLLHAPQTKTNTSIPFVVLATTDIPEHKLERLRKDGAIVKVVEGIKEEWIKPGIPRWRDTMTKLRLFELVQYEKILFLDADMLIINRMDQVFQDSSTEYATPKFDLAKLDEAPLPESYMLSAQAYIEGRSHAYPPDHNDYFSSGFMLAKPSIEIFNYYISLTKIEGRFRANALEQDLLNYAHRRDGPMPWMDVYYQWTTTWPSMKEYEAGAASLHEKWWDESIVLDLKLRKLWYMVRGEMEGYYLALEQDSEQ